MTEHIPIEEFLKPVETTAEAAPQSSCEAFEGSIQRHPSTVSATEELVPIKKRPAMAKCQSSCCRTEWCVKDGLGMTCSGITYFLIIFAEFVVIAVILAPAFPNSPWSYVHTVLFTFFAFMAAMSHLRSMITNPGAIPKGNFTEDNVRRLGLAAGEVVVRCTRCECIKTDRAHHCSTCGRCIRKMDHHCPWINNCVGEANQKYFVLFTFYIMVISIYAIILAVHYVFTCSDKDWKGSLFDEIKHFMLGSGFDSHTFRNGTSNNTGGENCAYFSPATTIIFIIFLIFEGLLFGLFTMIMCCTQINSIVNDETGIEHIKKEARDKEGDWKSRMKETFGGEFSIAWLSPFTGTLTHRKRTEYSSFDV